MILFIRHGQTDYNIKHLLAGGDIDLSINSKGEQQAAETGWKLKNTKIDLVYCSPLLRAKQTAEKVLRLHKDAPIIYDDRLKERFFGELNGKIDSDYPDCWRVDFDEGNGKVKGMESLQHFHGRCKDFIDEISNLSKDKNILVVAHNGVGRMFKCIFYGFPESGNLDDYDVDNGEVLIFD